MVKPGDTIPDVPLLEGAPDKKVSLANELSSGKGLIVAVPAAFSTTISVPSPANPHTLAANNIHRPWLYQNAHTGVHKLRKVEGRWEGLRLLGERSFRVCIPPHAAAARSISLVLHRKTYPYRSVGAWQEKLDPEGKSGIRFLADKDASFAKAIDAVFEMPVAFGDPRSKRLALTTLDGKIDGVYIEPDGKGIDGRYLVPQT